MPTLGSPQVDAAAIAAVVALVVGLLTSFLTFWAAERKLSREHRLTKAVERGLVEMLSDPEWRLRSLVAIKLRFKGLKDEELRRLLMGAGAMSFESKSGIELWGLINRNRDRLSNGAVNADPGWREGGDDEHLPDEVLRKLKISRDDIARARAANKSSTKQDIEPAREEIKAGDDDLIAEILAVLQNAWSQLNRFWSKLEFLLARLRPPRQSKN